MSRKDAIEIFKAAVEAVQPEKLIPRHVSLTADSITIGDTSFLRSETGKVIVIGAGKASAAMALAIEKILLPVIDSGLIVTKYEHSLPLSKIQCIEAGHPVPDQNGIEATTRIKLMVSHLDEKDLVIFLASGGASALLADVPVGISLADIRFLAQLLLSSGANIEEINTVRKHLSFIKGGQLSKTVSPAKLISLILSDVNGDDLSVIASGPTVGDHSSFSEALSIIHRYDLRHKIPDSIIHWLNDGADGKNAETPYPGDPLFKNTVNLLIGTNSVSLRAAELSAVSKGYHVVVVNNKLEGEAEQQAVKFVEACQLYDGPVPACLLMGGETTVTIKGIGMGGRNQHFVLAALCEMQKGGREDLVILSGGTDGTDGPTDAAGAVTDGGSLDYTDAPEYLVNNDAYHFFEKNGGLIKTGPTQTNVMDIVVGLISSPRAKEG